MEGHGNLREGFVVASTSREKFSEGAMDGGGWSQFERGLELPFRALPIPLERAQKGRQRGVRLGQVGVVMNGIFQMPLGER